MANGGQLLSEVSVVYSHNLLHGGSDGVAFGYVIAGACRAS